MAKLPDITSMGGRPTPRVESPVRLPSSPVNDAVAGLGQSIAGLGEAFQQKQIQDDKYRTEDVTNKLQQSMIDLSVGEDGFDKKKSGDVLAGDFYKDNMDRLEQSKAEIEKTLSNDEQKQAFNRRYEVAKIGFGSKLATHITRETDAYQGQVYTGGISIEQDIAAASYADENTVRASLLRTQKLTEAELDRKGIKGDAKKAVLAENASNIHLKVIENAIDSEDYGYATEWYKKNKKNILGSKHGDVEKALKTSGLKVQSQSNVDEYVTMNLDESEASAEARKIKDAEVRDATLSRVKVRYNEAAQIKDREQKVAGEAAWDILAKTGNIDDIPESILNDMDGKERVSLQSTAAKPAVVTDFQTYYGLKQMIRDDPSKFKSENLARYTHLLAPTELKELTKLQTDDKGIVIASTKGQITNRGAAGIGLIPSEASKKGNDGDKVRAYYRRIDEEVEAEQIIKGKELTTKEISDITDRMSIEVIRERSFWFDAETSAGLAEIEGIPTNMIDELASAVQKANQPVTEDNIRSLYIYMQGKK